MPHQNEPTMTHFCVAIDHLLVTTAADSILVSTSQPIYQLILSSWAWINFADLECSLKLGRQTEENVYLPILETPADGETMMEDVKFIRSVAVSPP